MWNNALFNKSSQRCLYAHVKRWVFNPALNCPRLMDDERSCDGSAFQTVGAAMWKLCRPSCVLVKGTNGKHEVFRNFLNFAHTHNKRLSGTDVEDIITRVIITKILLNIIAWDPNSTSVTEITPKKCNNIIKSMWREIRIILQQSFI